MTRLGNRLFIGVGGHVVALDPASGELFRLDAATGAIMWKNRLKGLGMGTVAFTGGSDAVAAAVTEQQRRAAEGAATG